MDKVALQREILKQLYQAYFESFGDVILPSLRGELDIDRQIFDKVVERMEHESLIEATTLGGGYRITAEGIIHAETTSCVPEELSIQNRHIRNFALDELAKLYETDGIYKFASSDSLAEELHVNGNQFAYNLILLDELGYVNSMAAGMYHITHHGLDAVEEWRHKVGLVDEFQALDALSPQKRGREFQRLVARLLASQGWSQEEGARTTNEEIDVAIGRAREYYLIECKWEKTAIQANVVRDFYGKLSKRPDIRGIIMSMSGFTSGATDEAAGYLHSRLILLFGLKDIHSLFETRTLFEDMLNQKYKAATVNRKIVWQ